MLAPRESLTPATPSFIEGLLDPKGPLVLQVILVKMALMVGLEEWACVALQASQDFEGKMDHPELQDAQRREMMEMMVGVSLVEEINDVGFIHDSSILFQLNFNFKYLSL